MRDWWRKPNKGPTRDISTQVCGGRCTKVVQECTQSNQVKFTAWCQTQGIQSSQRHGRSTDNMYLRQEGGKDGDERGGGREGIRVAREECKLGGTMGGAEDRRRAL
jgi:hypothetical protein